MYFLSQLDDEARVVGLGHLAPHEAPAQPPQLVAVEVVDVLVHELGTGRRRRSDAVTPQRLAHERVIVDGHGPRGVPGACREVGYAVASASAVSTP